MKSALALVIALMLLSVPAFSDPGDEDDRAHGRRDHRVEVNDDEYEEEFRVGNCKVEREWERDGDYREERECDQDD
jgi:hypothetical protein